MLASDPGESPDPMPTADPIPPPPVPLARPVTALRPPESAAAHPMRLAGASRRQAALDVLFILGSLVIFEFLLGQSLPLLFDVPEADTPEFDAFHRGLLIPVLTLRALFVTGLILLVLRRHGQPAASIGVNHSPGFVTAFIQSLIGLACTAAAYLLMIGWILIAGMVWPGWDEQMRENASQLVSLIPAMHPLWFIPLMLLVSAYEELLFRGFIMTRLRRALGSWTPAVVLSAALFTLAHMGDQKPAVMPIIAGLALIFSLATIWTRSLLPAIVGHFLFNLSQMIGIYLTSPEWQAR